MSFTTAQPDMPAVAYGNVPGIGSAISAGITSAATPFNGAIRPPPMSPPR